MLHCYLVRTCIVYHSGGALLLMSDSSTDIARVLSHRRRLAQGHTQSETTGEYHNNFYILHSVL